MFRRNVNFKGFGMFRPPEIKLFVCNLENLDRKKISVSKWLVNVRAEEGITRSS